MIPVMGHVGLTPQSPNALGVASRPRKTRGCGGTVVAGMRAEWKRRGATAAVLEAVPRELAAQITGEPRISTIGIGAGLAGHDRQILVGFTTYSA